MKIVDINRNNAHDCIVFVDEVLDSGRLLTGDEFEQLMMLHDDQAAFRDRLDKHVAGRPRSD